MPLIVRAFQSRRDGLPFFVMTYAGFVVRKTFRFAFLRRFATLRPFPRTALGGSGFRNRPMGIRNSSHYDCKRNGARNAHEMFSRVRRAPRLKGARVPGITR